MPAPADTTVDVRTLIDRPGATLSLDRRMPAPSDVTDELVELGPQVSVDALVESVVDGLLVRGAIIAPATLRCARCLAERVADVRADVVELFSARPDTDEAGYEIVDATIDLDTLLRDALADALPVRPLCRPDCAGLCPICGGDRNPVATDEAAGDGDAPLRCDGHAEESDPRWSALRDLHLPDTR